MRMNMPKKRIVQFIITLELGGCESALLRMLPLLSEDFESIIVTLRNKGPLAPMFESKGIRVISIGQKNIFDIPSYFRIKNIFDKIVPDLVITNLLHADIVGRFFIQFLVPCKVISSLVTTYNFKRYWQARLFERLSRYLAKGYMANASSVKDIYVKKFHVPQEKISVVPAGMDIDLFSSAEKDENLKRELAIECSDRVMICVGYLHTNKGHKYLLEAFEKLYATQPNIKLLIVGVGEEKENLIKQIEHYLSKKSILFLGRRNDIPKLLRISDVFILPTFFEGMSNAIMEAMASGLPIITTDIPENRELVAHEKTALLCSPGDSDCIFHSLKRIFNDSELAKSLGQRAHSEIERKYNLEDTAKQWVTFFSLMANK